MVLGIHPFDELLLELVGREIAVQFFELDQGIDTFSRKYLRSSIEFSIVHKMRTGSPESTSIAFFRIYESNEVQGVLMLHNYLIDVLYFLVVYLFGQGFHQFYVLRDGFL